MIARTFTGSSSVSYTHLDVYKRQGWSSRFRLSSPYFRNAFLQYGQEFIELADVIIGFQGRFSYFAGRVVPAGIDPGVFAALYVGCQRIADDQRTGRVELADRLEDSGKVIPARFLVADFLGYEDIVEIIVQPAAGKAAVLGRGDAVGDAVEAVLALSLIHISSMSLHSLCSLYPRERASCEDWMDCVSRSFSFRSCLSLLSASQTMFARSSGVIFLKSSMLAHPVRRVDARMMA